MSLQYHDLHPGLADFEREVLDGLAADPKRIAPKFFYDRRGSELFDAITELPEYYPTRTEIGILERHGREIADLLGEGCLLYELGSGSSRKIRVLLESLRPMAYVPIDISGDHLLASTRELSRDFPEIQMHAVCADYTAEPRLPEIDAAATQVAFYPGSSIGNFDPTEAAALLRRVATMLGRDGMLLIGVDLQKATDVLDRAYNDSQGVTAEFNLNLLHRINRELAADIDPAQFEHRAFYNESLGRIEMHLAARRDLEIRVAGRRFRFQAGESIHTENSYKYTAEGFASLAATAGFRASGLWIDPDRLFSVHALRVG